MQGNYQLKLTIFVFAGLIALLAATGNAWAGQEGEATVNRADTPVGLVMDSRGNTYTADRTTGKIFRLDAGGEHIHYATVGGKPSALAVDRRGTLFIGTETGRIHGIHRDGTVFNAGSCQNGVTGLTVDRDGSLFVATGSGAIIKMVVPASRQE